MCSARHVSAGYLPLSGQELAGAGEALFGARWREELAVLFGVTERYLESVERGHVTAPTAWRGHLIAAAQDMALKALGAASDLLCQEEESVIAASERAKPLYV